MTRQDINNERSRKIKERSKKDQQQDIKTTTRHQDIKTTTRHQDNNKTATMRHQDNNETSMTHVNKERTKRDQQYVNDM